MAAPMNMVTDVQELAGLFSDGFLAVNSNDIITVLNEKGYYAFPSAIPDTVIDQIERNATANRLSLNLNTLGGAYAERQYFHSNLLAVSKSFFDLCTSRPVTELCYRYLGESFRLRAQRYSETYGWHQMQWHTDNKTDESPNQVPGLIFLIYISDVDDGEFQYVEGSHTWSNGTGYSNYSDTFINSHHASAVKSFKLPRGSLLICDTRGIHRARPVFRQGFVRKSVLFQVDQGQGNSLPIIVNTEFLTQVDNTLAMYLGFGRGSGYRAYPDSSLETLRITGYVLGQMIRWGIIRTLRSPFFLIPRVIKNEIRRALRDYRE